MENNKEENVKQKMLVATISKCVADRDAIKYNICYLLDSGGVNNDVLLKKEFEALSSIELTIQTIQLYYAKNFSLPENES